MTKTRRIVPITLVLQTYCQEHANGIAVGIIETLNALQSQNDVFIRILPQIETIEPPSNGGGLAKYKIRARFAVAPPLGLHAETKLGRKVHIASGWIEEEIPDDANH